MAAPLIYSPDVETAEADEDETIAKLNEQFAKILETTSQDYGHAVRSVHAKGHGLARGRLDIAQNLPPELAQGLFAVGGSHDAILRFSTNAGDILDDDVRLPRGVALKILNVEGERLPGSESDLTQDFLLVNGPAFSAATPKKFLSNLKLLAATTDKAEGAKKMLSTILRGFEATLEALGKPSPSLSTLGGAKPVHPLGATYYSQTPFRYGAHIAKFSLRPVSPSDGHAAETIDAGGRPDAIRDAMNEALVVEGGAWDLQVQLCTDLDVMPIEDPSVIWDEALSPFRTVARLTVAPQAAWVIGESEQEEDQLSFSPWHGLAAHRPLGAINRARKKTYEYSASFRSRFNGCPVHEPTRLDVCK